MLVDEDGSLSQRQRKNLLRWRHDTVKDYRGRPLAFLSEAGIQTIVLVFDGEHRKGAYDVVATLGGGLEFGPCFLWSGTGEYRNLMICLSNINPALIPIQEREEQRQRFSEFGGHIRKFLRTVRGRNRIFVQWKPLTICTDNEGRSLFSLEVKFVPCTPGLRRVKRK